MTFILAQNLKTNEEQRPPGMPPEICNRGAVLEIWGQSSQPLEAIGGLREGDPSATNI